MLIEYHKRLFLEMPPIICISLKDPSHWDLGSMGYYNADIICSILNGKASSCFQFSSKCHLPDNELENTFRTLTQSIDVLRYKEIIDHVLLWDKKNSPIQKLFAYNIAFSNTTKERLGMMDLLNYNASIIGSNSPSKDNGAIVSYNEIVQEVRKITDCEERFRACCDYLFKNEVVVSKYQSIRFDNFLDFFKYILSEAIDKGEAIKLCKNCGKYFYPAKRSDAIYCDNTSPQDPKKTCKVYGAAATRAQKEKEDEATGLYRKVYMSKQMLAKRNPDLSEYKESFDKFRSEAKLWKSSIKAGEKNSEAFISWLKEVKEKKVL